MTIQLIEPVNIAGQHVAPPAVLTLSDGLEADLVARGKAFYSFNRNDPSVPERQQIDTSLRAYLGDEGAVFLLSTFGEDIMLVTTFANLPAASSVPVGKCAIVTDIGNAMYVNRGDRWYPVPPTNAGVSALSQSITDTAPQGTTESTLLTFAYPLGFLPAGYGLEIEGIASCSNSAATKRMRARFGGTVLFNLDLTTHLVFPFKFRLRNRATVAGQIGNPNSTTIFGPIGSVGAQTFTVDFAAAQTLTLTGQFPVAGSGANTFAFEEVSVKII